MIEVSNSKKIRLTITILLTSSTHGEHHKHEPRHPIVAFQQMQTRSVLNTKIKIQKEDTRQARQHQSSCKRIVKHAQRQTTRTYTRSSEMKSTVVLSKQNMNEKELPKRTYSIQVKTKNQLLDK